MENKLSLDEKLVEIGLEFELGKGKWNKHGQFYYRTLPQILSVLKPLGKKHRVRFKLTSHLIEIGGKTYNQGIAEAIDLDSKDRDESHSYAEIPQEIPRGMGAAQSSGSSETYSLKRALGNLIGIDDDENLDPDAQNNTSVVINQTKPKAHMEAPQTPQGDKKVQDLHSLRTSIVQKDNKTIDIEYANEVYKEVETLGKDEQTLKLLNTKINAANKINGTNIIFDETNNIYKKGE